MYPGKEHLFFWNVGKIHKSLDSMHLKNKIGIVNQYVCNEEIQDSRFKFIKTKWQQSLNYMVIYNYKTLKITKSLY